MAGAARTSFDPYAVLKALDRHRVTYVVIGAFARVIQGSEELTRGIDIVLSTRPENLRRLGTILSSPASVRSGITGSSERSS